MSEKSVAAATPVAKTATPPNTDAVAKHRAAPASNYSLMSAVTAGLAAGNETPAEKAKREADEKAAPKKGDNDWHDETPAQKAEREKAEKAGAGGGAEETEEEKAARIEAGGETEEEKAARIEAGGETEEEKAARIEAGGETEEEKTAREAEEAAAAAGETPEEKAAREAEEKKSAQPHGDLLKKLDAETKAYIGVMLKKLKPEDRALVEKVIGSRIGKIVVTERTERERLEARVTEMTTELEQAEQAKGPAVVAGVHPLQLAETEEQLNAEEDKLQGFLDWLDDNKDGYEGDASKNERSFSAEEIRARRREVEHDLRRTLPQARAGLQKRAAAEKDLRTVYPDLFDVKSAAYAERRRILKEQPELKRFPDYLSKVAQLVLGAKAFADLKKAKDAPKTKLPLKKVAPRAPGSGGPAKGGSSERKPAGSVAPAAMKSFAANPSGGALTSLVAGVLGKG